MKQLPWWSSNNQRKSREKALKELLSCVMFFCCLMHTINISKEGGPAYEFYFPQVHYTAGISAPLLLRIFEQHSCTVGVLPCSSHMRQWLHLHVLQKRYQFEGPSSPLPLPPVVRHSRAPLTVLGQLYVQPHHDADRIMPATEE